jgi:hypothetical protein
LLESLIENKVLYSITLLTESESPMKSILIFVFVFFTACDTLAQRMKGYLYHAAYVPQRQTKQISIDGNLEEWSWIPEVNRIENSDLMNADGVTVHDLDVGIRLAWSKTTNMVYVIASVKDDILNTDKLKSDDAIDININPNRASCEYWIGSTYKLMGFNICHFVLTPMSTRSNVHIRYGPRWMLANDYFQFAVKVKKLPDGRREMCYEIAFKIFENLSLYSSQLSSISVLRSGKIVGLTIAIDDVDSNPLEKDTQLRTYSGKSYKHQGEEASDVVLDAPQGKGNLFDELLLLSDH